MSRVILKIINTIKGRIKNILATAKLNKYSDKHYSCHYKLRFSNISNRINHRLHFLQELEKKFINIPSSFPSRSQYCPWCSKILNIEIYITISPKIWIAKYSQLLLDRHTLNKECWNMKSNVKLLKFKYTFINILKLARWIWYNL